MALALTIVLWPSAPRPRPGEDVRDPNARSGLANWSAMSEAGSMSLRQTRFEGNDAPPGAQTAIELQRDGGEGSWAYALAALRRPDQFFQAGHVYRMQAYVRDVDATGAEAGLLLANHQMQHRPTLASVYAGYKDSSWHLLSRTFVAAAGAADDTSLYFALPPTGAMHWQITRASVQEVWIPGPHRVSGPPTSVLSFTGSAGSAPKATQWTAKGPARVNGAGHLAVATGARLTTIGKVTVKPGSYVETAVRLPGAVAARPVVALIGTSIAEVGWPAAGELDLLAAAGGDQAIAHLAAQASSTQDRPYSVRDAGGRPQSAPGSQTHTYGVYFDDESARFYVDRVERGAIWAADASDSGRAWPFGSPQYLSLSLTGGAQPLTVGPIYLWTGGIPFI